MTSKLRQNSFTLDDVKITGRSLLFEARGRVECFTFRHRRHDGVWSENVRRELYCVGEASHVLIWDPAHDAVLLVEQFRPAGLVWNEPTWLIEGIAGMIDDGETPEETARREAREEAGCRVTELYKVATIFSSPGSVGERTHLFCATADLSDAHDNFHGLDAEHEDIRTLVVPLEQALEAVDEGRVQDVKTMALLQWLARNRHRVESILPRPSLE